VVVEQDIAVEQESDVESAFTTFLGSASEMPTFSEEVLTADLDPGWIKKVDAVFDAALSGDDRRTPQGRKS
jgi:hypothetical protein